MHSSTKLIFLSSGLLVLAGGLLLIGGCLSTPRDYSAPVAVIRVANQNGEPMEGVEVSRRWYDSDCGNEGRERVYTDQSGTSQFSKVSANVGLFTGAWRKTYSHLGMCASGSGTQTTIFVRYRGRFDVEPQGKTLHPIGESQQDQDGVWFLVSIDSQSNTLVELSFPAKTKSINYAISSKRHDD